MAASSCGALHELLSSRNAQLDHIHISAALGRLVVLAGTGADGSEQLPPPRARSQESQEHGQQQHMEQQQAHSSRSDAGVCGAEADAAHTLLVQLHAAAEAQVPAMRGRELAHTLWAVAKLSPLQPPPRPLLAGLLAALQPSLPRLTGQELSMAIYGAALLRLLPAPAWQRAWLAVSQQHMRVLSPQALANAAWALAQLHMAPGRRTRRWLAAWLRASYYRLPDSTPRALASMVWALAELRVVPPLAWQSAFLASCGAQLGAMDARCLANVLAALAEMGRIVPRWFAVAALQRLSRAAAAGDVRAYDLAQALWALGKLKVGALHGVGEAQLLACALRVDGELTPQGRAHVAYGLSQLQLRPSAAWLKAFAGGAAAHMRGAPGAWTPQALSTLSAALAALHRHPVVLVAEAGGGGQSGGLALPRGLAPAWMADLAGELLPLAQRGMGGAVAADVAQLAFWLLWCGVPPGRRLLEAMEARLGGLEAAAQHCERAGSAASGEASAAAVSAAAAGAAQGSAEEEAAAAGGVALGGYRRRQPSPQGAAPAATAPATGIHAGAGAALEPLDDADLATEGWRVLWEGPHSEQLLLCRRALARLA